MYKLKKIEEAIDNKKMISFTYDNHQRVAEPHHSGLFCKSDHVHCFQTSGESHSGKPYGWKNFSVDKIKDLVILYEKDFEPKQSHNPSGSKYTEIYKSVTDVAPKLR